MSRLIEQVNDLSGQVQSLSRQVSSIKGR
ncbi:hypothetical protein [Hafnia paralvei]